MYSIVFPVLVLNTVILPMDLLTRHKYERA